MRVLYISGSIGLGHADRDLAIARELRALDPDVEIDWLAGAPARERIAAAGETVLPECAHLDETVRAEEITSGFGFNVLGAIVRQRHEMIDSVKAFASVTRDGRYDLVIGDEAYAELEALRRKPRLKRSPFVMIYDCVGVEAMSRNPLEHLCAVGRVAGEEVPTYCEPDEHAYRARPGLGAARCERNRRSRSALKTTDTLENAIAAPAMTGFSSPSAASGSAATL